MKLSSLLLLLFAFCLTAEVFSQKNYPAVGKVVYSTDKLRQLIPEDARIEVLAMGFTWSEGPVWIKEGNYLLFSDVPGNSIYKWNEKDGISEFLKPSGYTGAGTYSDEPGSNGLTLNHKGQLVLAEHGDRRIAAMPLSGGGKITLADHYHNKRFNSPNDVIQHPVSHEYYFTDPPYGLLKKEKDPTREIDFFGVYKITVSGEVILLDKTMTRPNGLALSPDGTTLYVAQSDPASAILKSFPLKSDGSIGEGKVLYDATPMVKQGLPGLPDGLKTDTEGNLWASGPGGILILDQSGTLLGRIDTGTATANCAWGDDGKTLYITANNMLCRIKTNVKGTGF